MNSLPLSVLLDVLNYSMVFNVIDRMVQEELFYVYNKRKYKNFKDFRAMMSRVDILASIHINK